MKRLVIGTLVGLAIGYVFMRLSRRSLLSEEDELAETPTSAPAP